MIGFSFLYPKFLLLLFLVPLFVFVYFFSIVYTKKRAFVFSNFEAMERFYGLEFFSRNFFALYLNITVLVLMVLAIAGTSVSFDVDTSDFSFVVLIDSSDSMSTKDISPTRFEAAKRSARDFVDLLPLGVEVGIVSFSGDAVVLQELDVSKIKAKMAISSASFGDVHGTNIYNALITANKLFGDRKMKAIILISDGQLNVADSPQVVSYIKRSGLVVHTIAIGTEEGGLTEYNALSKLDEDFLRSVALSSDGQFFRATDIENLGLSFTTLAEETNRRVTLDLSFYLLLASITIFSILWILYSLRFKAVP